MKAILVSALICVAGYQSISLTIDHFAAPGSDTTQARQQSDSQQPSQQQIDALLAGADPTDLFEPTAAGPTPPCFRGELEMAADVAPQLSGYPYVSLRVDQYNYIRVLSFDGFYLVQHPHQSVSATERWEVPKAAEDKLNAVSDRMENCKQRTLYLSSIQRENAA